MASRRPPLSLRLWVILLLALASSPARGDEPPPSLAQAQAALAAGRWIEARDAFQALLDRANAAGADPAARVPLQRGLGQALLSLGEPYEALAHLEAVAGRGTDEDRLLYAEALVAHARANLASGAVAASKVVPYLEDALTAARATEPDEAVHDRRLAVVGEAQDLAGRTEAAAEAWRAVPLPDPPSTTQRWCRERLGHALYRLGHHREAAEAFESLGLRHAAAAAWAAAKDGERALAHYAALLVEHPDDVTLLEEALSTARFTGGQARLDAILAALPGRGEGGVPILRARARLAEQRGDFAAAIAHLEAAQAALPALTPALAIDLARVRINAATGGQGARDAAAAALLEVWPQAREHPGLHDLMIAIAQQDFGDAWRVWPDRRPLVRCVALQRAALEGHEDDLASLQNLANSLRLAGEHAEALRTFERALALEPGDAGVRNDAGLALSAAGQAPEAVAAFRRARDDDPGLLAARQNLGRALWRAGDDVGAQAECLAALEGARSAGAPGTLYRFLADRAWRTGHRPERR